MLVDDTFQMLLEFSLTTTRSVHWRCKRVVSHEIRNKVILAALETLHNIAELIVRGQVSRSGSCTATQLWRTWQSDVDRFIWVGKEFLEERRTKASAKGLLG